MDDESAIAWRSVPATPCPRRWGGCGQDRGCGGEGLDPRGRTSNEVGSEQIAKLDLRIDGQVARRHVRIPFDRAASVRNGFVRPVLTDPQGSRALIVQWDRLP